MKKVFLPYTLVILLLWGCSTDSLNTSTASEIMVTEKNYSSDYTESWIMAYDPNNFDKKEVIKIVIKEPMVWNLIEINKKYTAVYFKEGESPWVLQQISHAGDNRTLR